MDRGGVEDGARTRLWGFRRIATHHLDPFMLPLAKRLPAFGVLTHRGRRSGRVYHTPVNVFRRGGSYFFILTYGADVDWVKNVLASGSCSVETRGRCVKLVDPQLVTDPELRPAPSIARFIERRIVGATRYVRMHRGVPPGA